jgi:hypothetical protein
LVHSLISWEYHQSIYIPLITLYHMKLRNLTIWVIITLVIVATIPTQNAQGYQTLKATIQTEGGTKKVEIRYYPGSQDWAQDIFKIIKEGFPLLEKRIGVPCPTPWDILIIETTNLAPGVGGVNKGPDGIEVPPDTSPNTIIHELCHFWFRHEPHGWSLEGFPEAYTIQLLKELERPEAYSHWISRLDTYQEMKLEIGDLPLNEVGYHPDFTDPRVGFMYAKTTVFCTWLIQYLGEETMHKINEVVVSRDRIFSEDYQEIAEDITGEDLDWLFSGWVFEGDYYYDGKTVDFDWFAGDGDHDGIPTLEEIEMGQSPFATDSDRDGLPDGQELFIRTEVKNPDTDNDGLKDGEEVPIILDGKNTEWSDPIIEDDRGDSELSGSQDIKAVYYATDEKYLYFMLEFYGDPSLAFHSGIRIDVDQDGKTDFIFFYICDYLSLSIWDEGQWVETVIAPQLLKGATVIADDVIEFRIPKRMDQVKFPSEFDVWAYEISVQQRESCDKTYSKSITRDQNFKESTNPHNPDSDGDGLLDGEDPEPLKVTEVKEPEEPEEKEPEEEEPKEKEVQPEKEPEEAEEPGETEEPKKETPFTGWPVLLGMFILIVAKRLQ